MQHGLRLAGEFAFCDKVEELGFQGSREVIVPNLDPGGGTAEALEYRLYGVVLENPADAERVLRQDGGCTDVSKSPAWLR